MNFRERLPVGSLAKLNAYLAFGSKPNIPADDIYVTKALGVNDAQPSHVSNCYFCQAAGQIGGRLDATKL